MASSTSLSPRVERFLELLIEGTKDRHRLQKHKSKLNVQGVRALDIFVVDTGWMTGMVDSEATGS